MAIFLGITALEGQLEEHYVWIYFVKVLLTGAALFYFRETWKDIRFEPKWIVPSVVVGLTLCAVWIWVDKNVAYPHFLGSRTGFNPYEKIADDGLRSVFLAVRFIGLVLLVPIMEELFWRSFVVRYASKPDFWTLPIGTFTWTGFAIMVGLFAAAHSEWLVAAIFAAAMGLLVKYSKSIFACIVAHAVTNLALGIYVVTQGDWKYW
ncbi:MAG: CAAX prenyl protease-related protein [Fimbriimonadales bacterium]